MAKIVIDESFRNYTLINSEGRVVAQGSIVHVVAGPNLGRAYRFESITAYGSRGTYRVRVSRKSVHAHFRSVEFLPPNALGCTVERPLTRFERFRAGCCTLWAKVDDWFWAGTFALIPLAVFEHFHLATKITEVVSLGMISGDTGSVVSGH